MTGNPWRNKEEFTAQGLRRKFDAEKDRATDFSFLGKIFSDGSADEFRPAMPYRLIFYASLKDY
ncbi:hypothetical protein [uncultured Mailhella sp.]|uniref:hypothetical protein n=1 Tax=uncultured Mailhella sp. TaxID=1981031 RepID=UPI0025F85DA0|nr:hypothetical protein [uncultured Mailhella sp.]